MDWKDYRNTLEKARSGRMSARDLADRMEARFAKLLAGVSVGAEDPVLSLLVGEEVASVVRRTGWSTLVLNPGSTSTKVAVYNGLSLIAKDEIPSEPGVDDGVRVRAQRIAAWIQKVGLNLNELSGIAARGGFLAKVPTGTYRVTPHMLEDLGRAEFRHASNLSVPMAMAIADMIHSDVVVSVTDPVTCDEVDALYRITGSKAIRTDGAAGHYLNLHALAQLWERIFEVDETQAHLGLCQMGGGMSAMRYLDGRMVQTVNAFGNIPSANRAGKLPLKEVISMLETGAYNLDRLRCEVTETGGGLLGLAGTDSFARFHDADPAKLDPKQLEKRQLVDDWFAARVAAGILELAAARRPLDAVILSGGLAHDEGFCDKVKNLIHLPVPVIRAPGSVEYQALAAGLLRLAAKPKAHRSYAEARDKLAEQRSAEDALLDTEIFAREKTKERKGGTLASLDDIIDAARPSGELPMVAIAGADNEEALLAAKLAAGDPQCRLARFVLLGPYSKVSHLAWELDVPIDEENFFIVDAEDPVGKAVELLNADVVDIIMKGSVTTAGLLKGYFRGLKKKGLTGSGLMLSHIGLFEIPGRPKLVALSDAAINPQPDLQQRVSILENSLRALHDLGLPKPKVAIISATEKVSDKVISSVEARDIASGFADREDLIIEGPISVDLALSPESAREKGYTGKIRGDADLLLVPTLDVGNAIYKAFTVTGHATIAGAVIGGDVPLVLTSRGDSSRSKLSSIALALVLAKKAKQRRGK